MAHTVWSYAATIPAGTAKASPATIELDLADQVVLSIDLEVPPGPLGAMGFAIYHSGTPILPRQLAEWFVWDDHYATWTLNDVPSGGGWSVVGYNTGQYDHTLYATFHTDPVAKAGAIDRFELPQYAGEPFTEYERLLLT